MGRSNWWIRGALFISTFSAILVLFSFGVELLIIDWAYEAMMLDSMLGLGSVNNGVNVLANKLHKIGQENLKSFKSLYESRAEEGGLKAKLIVMSCKLIKYFDDMLHFLDWKSSLFVYYVSHFASNLQILKIICNWINCIQKVSFELKIIK